MYRFLFVMSLVKHNSCLRLLCDATFAWDKILAIFWQIKIISPNKISLVKIQVYTFICIICIIQHLSILSLASQC